MKTLCSWLSTAFPAPRTDKNSDKATGEVPVARMSGAKRRKLAKEVAAAAEAKQKGQGEGEAKKPQTVVDIDNTGDGSLSEEEEIEIPPTSRFNLDK